MTVAPLTPLRAVWPPSPPAEPPPLHSYEAEQGLLGALLVNNGALERVRDFLEPHHFADPAHGRIFEAIRAQVDRGVRADPVTLKAIFDRDPALAADLPEEIRGGRYLVRLAAAVVAIVNAEDYGRTIFDLFIRRTAEGVLRQALMDVHNFQDLERPGARIVEEIAEAIQAVVAVEADRSGGLRPLSTFTETALKQTEAARQAGGVAGLPTGLVELDAILGGLFEGELILVGARPGIGKTDFASTVARHVARTKGPVAIFEAEMTGEQLARRDMAAATGVPANLQRSGKLQVSQMLALGAEGAASGQAPIFIDDRPAPTLSTILSRSRRLKLKQGLKLIIVDHLQLLSSGDVRTRRFDNRVAEMAYLTAGLKVIAKLLNVPVMALSQLNRKVEDRDDKRPQLADLRDSGTAEQDADVVIFLFREEYYLALAGEPRKKAEESQERFDGRYRAWQDALGAARGKAEAICAKTRSGPTGTALLYYSGAESRFGNLEHS